MNKIALIGAGQLGSRHLQGLAKSNIKISIEVVEPFEQAREIAKKRYEEINYNPLIDKINFFDSIEKLSPALDLVIIATSADVRSKVITELLSKKEVKNLVLEKVLFQTITEYDEIEQLLKETNTQCWVNHPRRMYPFYEKVKRELQSAKQISYFVQGGDWGLGCNGLHFIDHLSFLVDSENLILNNQFLDNKIYDSKRKGFIEFNGLLIGSIDQHTFSLHANHNGAPMLFSIVSDTVSFKINEASGEVKIAKATNNWKWEKLEEKIIYFQSELSHILIEEVLIHKNSKLPTYLQAKALHVPFLNVLLDKIQQLTNTKQYVCSIT